MIKQLIRQLSKLKISTLFALSIVLFSLVFVLLQSTILFNSTAEFLEKKISQSSLETSEQIGKRIEVALNNILDTCLNIRLSDMIHSLDNLDLEDEYAQICLIKDINSAFTSIVHSNENILGIYLLSNNLTMYNYASPNGVFKLDRLKGTSIYDAIESQQEGFVPTCNDYFSQSALNAKPKNAFYYFYTIKGHDKQNLATILICIDEKVFASSFLSLEQKDNLIFLFDEKGNLISPYPADPEDVSKQNELYTDIENRYSENDAYFPITFSSQKYLCMPIEISNGWSLVHLRSYQDIADGIGQLRSISLAIGVCCFIFSILIVLLFSNALTRPIYDLIEKIKLIGANNLDVEFDEFSTNEIGSINRQMNKITRKLKQNIADMKDNQQKMLKSECKALQSQINPHFLYNTLDAINWMAIRIGADNISTMSMQLGTFFRHSLNKGNLTTTIEAELDHLAAYTGIQEYRYDNRFTYNIAVDPQILQCTIVNLVLQPLVENSLLHGGANTNGACNIKIIGKVEGEDILLDVIDDGCGCDPEFMNRCLQKEISVSRGYGVMNVHQRLRIYFGAPYGLCYLPATLGTHARIRIPLHHSLAQKENLNV